MATRHVWTLILKDARLHGLGIALTQAGGLGLLAMAFYLRPSTSASREDLVFNVNFLAVLLWSDWLVSREKIKGTVQWLRTLPISDHALVLAKFAAQFLAIAAFWISSTLVFTVDAFYPQRLDVWCVSLLALLAFGSLAVAARWRFNQKLGQLLPPVALFVPLTVVILLRRSRTGLPQLPVHLLWDTALARALIAALLFGFCAVLAYATARWVSRSDTYQLVE